MKFGMKTKQCVTWVASAWWWWFIVHFYLWKHTR